MMACMQKSLHRKERARKRDLDKLSLDMIQCEKDGFGCHYGKWKALQEEGAIERKLPEGWRICAHCGKSFKPTNNGQKYCEYSCQRAAADIRRKDAIRAQMKRYRERKKAESKESSNCS
jgi:hypothetical protein